MSSGPPQRGNPPLDAREARLKVAYVLPSFPVASEAFVLSDIVALREQGHEVSVHCLRPARAGSGRLARAMGVPPDLRVSHPTPGRIAASLLSVLRRPLAAARLALDCLRRAWRRPAQAAVALACIPRALQIAEEVGARDADVVHAFWGRHPSLVLAALAQAPSRQRPVRSVFIGAYDLVGADFLVDIGLVAADVVFTLAEANRAFFEARGRPDVHVILRGIPLALAEGDPPERDPDLVVTASALTGPKNVAGVLAAFARARTRHPRLRLSVVGDGPLAGELAETARRLGLGDSVAFLGYLPRPELFRHMQAAKLFLFLSTKPSERLPNVLKEALYAGCALVAAPSVGIEELLKGPSWGRIVPADDDAAVDRAIDDALGEPEALAEPRREAARAFIEAELSSAASMAGYAAVWADALARAGRR